MKYKAPGTVIPSFLHEGEWTFTYIEDGEELLHELIEGTTFTSASTAKQFMREFCGVNKEKTQ